MIEKDLLKKISEIMPTMEGVEEFATLFLLSDDEFEIIAKLILSETKRAFNNPEVKLDLLKQIQEGVINKDDILITQLEIGKLIDSYSDNDLPQNRKDFFKELFSLSFNALGNLDIDPDSIVTIPIEMIDKNMKFPTYANITDAGMDVYCQEDYIIGCGETQKIPLGFKVDIPNGYELQIRPRSGLSLQTKLRICNSPGTIDSGYKDEVCLLIENIEPFILHMDYDFVEREEGIVPSIEIKSILHGKPYTLSKGDRIAQLVLSKISQVNWLPKLINGETNNRGGGFGHSGK